MVTLKVGNAGAKTTTLKKSSERESLDGDGPRIPLRKIPRENPRDPASSAMRGSGDFRPAHRNTRGRAPPAPHSARLATAVRTSRRRARSGARTALRTVHENPGRPEPRHHTKDSYPDLTRAFGGKRHTTVIRAAAGRSRAPRVARGARSIAGASRQREATRGKEAHAPAAALRAVACLPGHPVPRAQPARPGCATGGAQRIATRASQAPLRRRPSPRQGARRSTSPSADPPRAGREHAPPDHVRLGVEMIGSYRAGADARHARDGVHIERTPSTARKAEGAQRLFTAAPHK